MRHDQIGVVVLQFSQKSVVFFGMRGRSASDLKRHLQRSVCSSSSIQVNWFREEVDPILLQEI